MQPAPGRAAQDRAALGAVGAATRAPGTAQPPGLALRCVAPIVHPGRPANDLQQPFKPPAAFKMGL